ncbi:MAG: hypothetical protein ACRC92_21745 [Peptostreptococcaceae bacterium]
MNNNISKLTLHKPNQLIEIEGGYITSLQLLAYNYILHRLQQAGTNKLIINGSDFFSSLKLSKNYDELIKYFDKLQKVRVVSRDKKGKLWGGFFLLSAFEKRSDGSFYLEIPSILYDSLFDEEKKYYTTIKLLEQKSFSCIYTAFFYEILKKYEKINIPIFTLEKLKAITSTTDKYKEYRYFKQNVLKKAFKELNVFYEAKNIYYTFEEIKVSRKVESIKIIKNIITENDIVDKKMLSEKVEKAIKRLNKNRYISDKISIKVIESMLKKYNETDIVKALNELYNYNREVMSFQAILTAKIKDIINTKVVKNQLVEPTIIKNGLSEKDYEEHLKNEKKMSNSISLKKGDNFKNITISENEKILVKKHANKLKNEMNMASQEDVKSIDIQELKSKTSMKFHEMNEEVIRRQIEEEVAKTFNTLQGKIANRIRDMRIAQAEKMVLRSLLSKYVSLNELEEFCKVLDEKYGSIESE